MTSDTCQRDCVSDEFNQSKSRIRLFQNLYGLRHDESGALESSRLLSTNQYVIDDRSFLNQRMLRDQLLHLTVIDLPTSSTRN